MRVVFIVIHLFIVGVLFSQSEQSLKLEVQNIYFPMKISPLSMKYYSITSQFGGLTFDVPIALNSDFGKQNYLEQKGGVDKISFSQEKKIEIFDGLGRYEYYKNSFKYDIKEKTFFNFEMGLVKQSTAFNPNSVDFHYFYKVDVEYNITNNFGAYMYGQYFSSPLNGKEKNFESYRYMNSPFLQTETGAGIKANYKNINVGVGMKTIYNTQTNLLKPINKMVTKIIIGL